MYEIIEIYTNDEFKNIAFDINNINNLFINFNSDSITIIKKFLNNINEKEIYLKENYKCDIDIIDNINIYSFFVESVKTAFASYSWY